MIDLTSDADARLDLLESQVSSLGVGLTDLENDFDERSRPVEFDFPCSATFRLAEAEMNSDRVRREDYMTCKERAYERLVLEDEAQVEARFREMKLKANSHFIKPSPKKDSTKLIPKGKMRDEINYREDITDRLYR